MPAAPTPSDPFKVLVVDDEPDVALLVRLAFRRQIRSGELSFEFAGDGVEALERIDGDPAIVLVLTDINMPRMDGLALLRRLEERRRARTLKAVVVSAYGDMVNIRTAMNRGAFDFLVKPVELEDLEATVRRCLDAVRLDRQAQHVRELFGRYVSPEVAAALLHGPEGVALGGEKRTVTLLMSDLRGFSLVSETVPPEQVVEVLNLYLGRMAEVVSRYGGTVNEFIGDAVFVIFGAPVPRRDHAQRAVACALAMQGAMGEVNTQVAALGIAPLEMGIGVHTGEVVVGNIGSLRRAKYGVVGGHVNLTSRIEGYTVGGQVLISDRTLEAAGAGVQVSEYMQMQAKGFAEPITLYAVDALGAPYNLLLPAQEEHMTTLVEPLPVSFSVLDGKHLTAPSHAGRIVRLSARGAILQAAHPVRRLDDLRIVVPDARAPQTPPGEVYAKVLEVLPGPRYKLRFTAVPEEIAAALRRACNP